MGNPAEEKKQRLQKSEGMEDAKRKWPIKSTKQCSYGVTETEVASMGPAWVCTRFSPYVLWLLACSSVGLLTVAEGVSLNFCLSLGLFSSCWVVLFYWVVLFHLTGVSWRSVLSWRGNEGEWIWGRGEVGETGRNGEKHLVRMDYIAEESIFN